MAPHPALDVVVSPEFPSNTISRKHVAIDCRAIAPGGTRSRRGVGPKGGGEFGSYEFTFEDQGSTNGVFLNEVKRLSGTLRHGDVLQLGGAAGLNDGKFEE